MQIIAAVLLIGNTIRVAAFSRRRETGIMRLVGACNFSIQLPFLLEGAIAGLVGAVLACAGLVALQQLVIENELAPKLTFVRFIALSDVWATAPLVVVTGSADLGCGELHFADEVSEGLSGFSAFCQRFDRVSRNEAVHGKIPAFPP